MVTNIVNAIGNVVEAHEIDGVLFTLAADAVVRTNDVETGLLVARVNYPTTAAAARAFAAAVAEAQRQAAPAGPPAEVRVHCTDCHGVTPLPRSPAGGCPICDCPRVYVEPVGGRA